MGFSDFEEWAEEPWHLQLGGVTYVVAPPSVKAYGQLLAAAVAGEVNVGIVLGPLPEEVERVLETVGDDHPALGNDVYQQMVDNGLSPQTINRASVYGVYYWTRGEAYADRMARFLWRKPEDETGEEQPERATPKSR